MPTRSQITPLILLVGLLPLHLRSQTTKGETSPAAKAIADAASLPAYDVVSVHISKSSSEDSEVDTDDNVFIAKNAPLKEIVKLAYNIRNLDLITGLSGPVSSAHFDIEAKVLGIDGAPPRKFTDEQLQAMIIPVLANRFHLRARLEPRITTVYELVIAKGGPKFKLTLPETDDDSISMGFTGMDNTLIAKKTTMPGLAAALSNGPLNRVVLEHTGLKGEGDFTLKWSSEAAEEQGNSNLVSIFTAVEEQLGLRLQPAKLPVDTLVIDHAEMPSQN
jgi:bla regulator protein BlaR1